MTRDEIIEQFIKIEELPEKIIFNVMKIDWDGHIPVDEWCIFSEITGAITVVQRKKEISRILRSKRYFHTCTECNELNPNGWMHDKIICQSCAEKNLDVVY